MRNDGIIGDSGAWAMSEAGHVIQAYLTSREPTIGYHGYGALLWVVYKE